jgi:hypothetical protein
MPDLRIRVEVDEAQLFGNRYPQEDGYDPYLSGQRFCDLLRQQVRDRYPDANLRIVYTDYGAANTAVTSWERGVDTCCCTEMVIDDIADAIYESRNWEVAR